MELKGTLFQEMGEEKWIIMSKVQGLSTTAVSDPKKCCCKRCSFYNCFMGQVSQIPFSVRGENSPVEMERSHLA